MPVTVPLNQFKVLILTIMHTSDKFPEYFKFPEFSRVNKFPGISRFSRVVSTLRYHFHSHTHPSSLSKGYCQISDKTMDRDKIIRINLYTAPAVNRIVQLSVYTMPFTFWGISSSRTLSN